MIRVFFSLAALILTAGMPAAQEYFPAFYRVTGVAPNDTLNVRLGPGPEHEVVTALAPNATNIEVVGRDEASGWLLLNTPDEWSGYASPRFLERLAGPPMNELPLPLNCGGTEPFWGIGIGTDGTGTYYDPEKPEQPLTVDWQDTAAARQGDEFGLIMTGTDEKVHAVIHRQVCSDGMSDFSFGLKMDAIVRSGNLTFMLTGCCQLNR